MAVLSATEILKNIEAGEIQVTPFDPKSVGCASIDLTLSNEFRYYKPGLKVLPVKESTNYKDITEKIVLPEGEGFLLLPGQACLGITVETVRLSPRLCGLLEGRSRFARLGCVVHLTAGFMQSGINNRQVLEFYNASSHPLLLLPGVKVCQFVFMRMEGEATYQGQFAVQEL